MDDWSTYHWFHSIDLGDGCITAGHKSLSQLAAEEARFFDEVDLRGATVIDVGAWNGAFTFAAARRGASRVLATDHYVWKHPQLRGRQAFDYANARLALPNVEAKEIDVPDLRPETVGLFDICLFLGVLYHLPSPLEGLERAASVVRECLIIETHTDLNDLGKPALAYYPGASLSNDETNFFGANVDFIVAALRELDFARFDVFFAAEHRVIVHAWRSTSRRRFRGDGPVEFHSARPTRADAGLKLELERIQSSRSWKLTAPLRRLSRIFGLARD